MIHLAIVRVVEFSARWHQAVIIAGTLLMLVAATFDATHFSINTDTESLISEDLPWHQRQIALTKAFPPKGIIAVVRAPSTENAEQATNLLAQALSRHADLFPLVTQPDSGDLFERNGMLFKPLVDVRKSAEGFADAARHCGACIRSKPSWRSEDALVRGCRREGWRDQARAADVLFVTG
jgi:hypothetical protein